MYMFIKIRAMVADIITNGKDEMELSRPRSQTNNNKVDTKTNRIQTKENELGVDQLQKR